MSFAKIVKHLW